MTINHESFPVYQSPPVSQDRGRRAHLKLSPAIDATQAFVTAMEEASARAYLFRSGVAPPG